MWLNELMLWIGQYTLNITDSFGRDTRIILIGSLAQQTLNVTIGSSEI